MRDPYVVLGLAKTAGGPEIKSAFRKLAKKFHPDQSKEARAKEKFAEIGQAYEILGDEKKRAAFDRGEIDAEGKPRAPQFEGFGRGARGGGPDFNHFSFDMGEGQARPGQGGINPDIFSELFGGGGRQSKRGRSTRGEDVEATAMVPVAQIVSGGSVRVVLPSGKALDVAVPVGVEDGRQIRLRGQGGPSARGDEPGDAIVTVRYAAHPYFRVDGRDLRLDLPVTLYEAILGGAVRVPTLGGAVEMNIAPGSSGKTLRLRGKGLPAAGDKPAGDLFATLRIALPAKEDAELVALMTRWRETQPYDPRTEIA